jgi:hypothetical protein
LKSIEKILKIQKEKNKKRKNQARFLLNHFNNLPFTSKIIWCQTK